MLLLEAAFAHFPAGTAAHWRPLPAVVAEDCIRQKKWLPVNTESFWVELVAADTPGAFAGWNLVWEEARMLR